MTEPENVSFEDLAGVEDREVPLVLSTETPIVFRARIIQVDDPPLFLNDREEDSGNECSGRHGRVR